MSEIKGRIHSFESFGAVDGPGIRFVAFMQGCPLRCVFCHNPDTWTYSDGTEYSVNEVFQKICSYKNFIKSGGVTLSGGEPLLQADFVEALLQMCKDENLHTALDTSGIISLDKSQKAIDIADMLLLDIKALDENDCIAITGQDNKNAIDTLNYCEKTKKPVWIRHVCIPDMTLIDEKIKILADFLKQYKCVEKVELIPFHQMGAYKWEYVDTVYTLSEQREPTAEEMSKAKQIFSELGINVH